MFEHAPVLIPCCSLMHSVTKDHQIAFWNAEADARESIISISASELPIERM